MATPSIVLVPDRYKSGVLYSQLPESGAVDFGVTRATTAYRTNASGVLESVASGVPRLDYPASGGCPALLVEPAATNLALRSEEFDDAAWSKTTIGTGITPVVSSNAAIAPNGTLTADRVTFNLNGGTSSSDASAIIQTVTAAIGTYTRSVYLKSGDGNNYDIIIATTTTPATFLKVTVTPQWQRFSLSVANTLANPNFWIGLRNAGGVTGLSNTAVIDCWGAQFEEGSVATSYIPTVASTVTRNADVISKTGVSGFIGQTEGTIYAEISNSFAKTVASQPITLWSASVNRLQFFINSSNQLSFQAVLGGSVVLQITTTVQPIIGINKIALAYQSGSTSLYLNGALIGSSLSSYTVPPCDSINIGSNAAGTNQLNDRIRAAAIYTSRLSNAELAALTTL